MAQQLSLPVEAQNTGELETVGVWFGAPRRPALGWLSRRGGEAPCSAVLILPPLGYAYLSTHRTLRRLAERLAAQGHLTLRIDYDGTGDSAGDQWDPARLAAWRSTIEAATEHLRALGAQRLAIVGAGLGGTFAQLDGPRLGAERIVAWAPVASGRRHARELRLLSTALPVDEDPLEPPGTRVFAGNVFSAETLADLARLETPEPVAEVETLVLDDSESLLETPPEIAAVPERVLEAIGAWVGAAEPRRGELSPTASTATFTWRGGEITEQVLRIGGQGHVAIATAPLRADASRATLIFLNSGSETHVGPGRAWVELARDLALRGHRSVRVDFRGWGESPESGAGPGRPYDAACVPDTVAIVDALANAGHQRVVLFGLCAAAWISLRVVLEAPVAGVIALNPQMYWKPGDPVDIDWQRIRGRRAEEIRRITRGERLRLWSTLDRLGDRRGAARWLEQLAATGIPVELLFSEGDDGLTYLRQRFGRRLAAVQQTGAVTVTELEGIDHPLHRSWRRQRVVGALHDALQRIDRV